MRRALLICLALVLTLVGWTTVGAEDNFYVIPSMRGNYAPVPKTGQTTSYTTPPIDDGGLQKGVSWPTPRFTNNNNGTVTDNLTGLIWTRNANAFGVRTWDQALSDANGLQNGQHDLTDGSKPGEWRLPNLRELQSLVDYGRRGPALPANNFFTGVQSVAFYWSSTTAAGVTTPSAWTVFFVDGSAQAIEKVNGNNLVWCVRGGR